MTPFTYARATDAKGAIGLFQPESRYLGGGTNLVDLMRETIERPPALIDVTALSDTIEPTPDGGLMIGAAAKNTALAAHPLVRRLYPVLCRAILAGASAQIRNMATVGGNVLQRTRCYYFYDTAARCNKRKPGSGCDAIDGFNRIHAILGASPDCVATHPSDMCVALAALDTILHLDGPEGARSMPLVDFHRLPGGRPDIETEIRDGELITAIELPAMPFAAHSTYRKIRDVRLALGGVAHKPWRAAKAEAAIRAGASFAEAAEAELADAAPLKDNAFKVTLAKRAIVATLEELSA